MTKSIQFLLLIVTFAADVAAADSLHERLSEQLETQRDMLIEFRRDLHRHPETSGQEKRTSAQLSNHLKTLGFAVREGIGGYGIVAILEGGQPGRVVAFRADMDALHSSARDPVDFRSENSGIRHICGHDIHMTIGIALAEGFAAVRESLPGSVMLIFQPSEEAATGARSMIADGAFDAVTPDAVFAVHTAPMPVGSLLTRAGTLMTWRDQATFTLSGKGSLDSASRRLIDMLEGIGSIEPEQARTPIAGDFLFVQTRPLERNKDGARLISIISTSTETASDSARDQIEAYLRETEFTNVHVELQYEQKWIAGVTNDPELTRRAIVSARSALAIDAVGTTTKVIPNFSEDFGSFQQIAPGVMFFLGVSNSEKGWVGMPHTPGYVADEESIFVGARSMGAIMLDFLAAE